MILVRIMKLKIAKLLTDPNKKTGHKPVLYFVLLLINETRDPVRS